MDTFLWEELLLEDLQPLFLGTEHNHAPDVDPILESAQEFVAGLPSLDWDDQNNAMEAEEQAIPAPVHAAPARPHLQVAPAPGPQLQILPAVHRWPLRAPESDPMGVIRRLSGTWEAHTWLPDYNLDREKRGMQCFVGSFSTVEEAKQAHDKAAIRFNLRVNKKNRSYELNYPQELYAHYIAEHAHWSRRDFLWKIRRDSPNFRSGKCRLRGVRLLKNKGKWNGRYSASMSLTVSPAGSPTKKKEMALGTFAIEAEAGMAYDKALLFVHGMYSNCITNFQPGLYSVEALHDMGCWLTSLYPGIDFKKHERVLQCLLDN